MVSCELNRKAGTTLIPKQTRMFSFRHGVGISLGTGANFWLNGKGVFYAPTLSVSAGWYREVQPYSGDEMMFFNWFCRDFGDTPGWLQIVAASAKGLRCGYLGGLVMFFFIIFFGYDKRCRLGKRGQDI